jgi:hypothetical protein
MRRLLAAVALVLSPGAALAQPLESPDFASAQAAYEWLLESPDFPPAVDAADLQAVEEIRQSALQIAPRLRRDLEKPASFRSSFPKSFGVFLDLGDKELQQGIARGALRTYGPTDRSPLSNFLAAYGDAEDMPRIEAEMRADPDGWAVGLALSIVLNNNAYGLVMLERLRTELPGAWQATVEGLELPPAASPDAVGEVDESEPPLVR